MNSKLIISTINYNSCDKTIRMIESLINSGALENSLFIILDNSEISELENILQRIAAIQINNPSIEFNVYSTGENIGFGCGHNLNYVKSNCGIEDYFLIINNDVLIEEVGFVNKLLYELDDLMIISPLILRASNNRIWSAGGYISKVTGDLICNKDSRRVSDLKLDFLSGCCLLMKGATYQYLSGFREDFFMYAEDLDFCIRAVKNGIKLKISSVKILHDIGSGTGGVYSNLYLYENTKNRLICLREHKLGMPFIRQIYFFAKYIFARFVQMLLYSKKPLNQIIIVAKGYLRGFS